MRTASLLLVVLGAFCLVRGEDEPETGVKTNMEMPLHFAPPYYTTTVVAEKYILPVLEYGVGALAPLLDETTMYNHYFGHHEAYKNKLNNALEEWRKEHPDNPMSKRPILEILQNVGDINPEFLTPIINNGGGYVNHAFYWACMSPNLTPNITERLPTGYLLEDIKMAFGSYDDFKDEFTKKALTLFGSGYVWLVRDPAQADKPLSIMTTANQDSPVSEGLFPILVIDVWEHAYYLMHKFRRPAHVEDWWKLVDWESVEILDEFWENGMKMGPKYLMTVTSDGKDIKEEL